MMATAADKKLLKKTKFPPEFDQKVDLGKVNRAVMKKQVAWIAAQIQKILNNEDDIVIDFIYNIFDAGPTLDIKMLQIQLQGFLDKDAPAFCKELWNLLLDAQTSSHGIPKAIVESKKQELKQEKVDTERAAEEERQRRENERRRQEDLDDIRSPSPEPQLL
ncbi:PWI domain-containing protein [Phyllosticta citrichinensis]